MGLYTDAGERKGVLLVLPSLSLILG